MSTIRGPFIHGSPLLLKYLPTCLPNSYVKLLKFADDTTVSGPIQDASVFRQEADQLLWSEPPGASRSGGGCADDGGQQEKTPYAPSAQMSDLG